MHYSLVFSSLLAVVGAVPIADPITIFNRAPTPGTVYTRCSTPNTLALAYDDGPYQYTQSIVKKLNQAGAKGTFFVTGTLYGMCICARDKNFLQELSAKITFSNRFLQVASTIRRQHSSLLTRADTRSPRTPGPTATWAQCHHPSSPPR